MNFGVARGDRREAALEISARVVLTGEELRSRRSAPRGGARDPAPTARFRRRAMPGARRSTALASPAQAPPTSLLARRFVIPRRALRRGDEKPDRSDDDEVIVRDRGLV